MSAQGSSEYKLRWYAELQGDDRVKAQMQALLDVQQRGRRAEQDNLIIARDARAELLEHTRALNTLTRSWEAAHPSLDLFTRSMSGLGSAAHAVLSVMNSINLLTVAQSEKQQSLADATIAVEEAQVKYNDAVKSFGALSPEAVKAHGDLNIKIEDQKKKMNALNDSWKDWAVTLAGIMVILGQMRRVITDITGLIVLLKSLDLGPLGAAFALLARYLPIIAAVAPGIGTLIDNLMKVTSLQDLWDKFAHDNAILTMGDQIYRDLIRIKSDLVTFSIILERRWDKLWKEDLPNLLKGGINQILEVGQLLKIFFLNTIPSWFHGMFVAMGEVANKKIKDIIDIFEALRQGAWDKVYQLANDLVFGSLWPEMWGDIVADTEKGRGQVLEILSKLQTDAIKIMVATAEGMKQISIADALRSGVTSYGAISLARLSPFAPAAEVTDKTRAGISYDQPTQATVGMTQSSQYSLVWQKQLEGAAKAIGIDPDILYRALRAPANKFPAQISGYLYNLANTMSLATSRELGREPEGYTPPGMSLLSGGEKVGTTPITVIVQGSLLKEQDLFTAIDRAIGTNLSRSLR